MVNKVEIVVGAQDNSKLDLQSLKDRLKDMGKMIETARVRVAGDKEGEIAVERLALKLAGVGKLAASPKITLTGAARAEVDITAVEVALDKLGDKSATAAVKVSGSGSAALSGAFTRLGGTLKGFGGLAAGALGVGLTGPLAAAGLAVAGFGALAAPTFAKVEAAMTKTGAAGKKAYAALDPAQRGIYGSLRQLQSSFDGLARSFEPVVASVVKMGASVAQALMPALAALAPAGAKVITAFLTPFLALLRSPFFAQFIAQMSRLAVQVAPVLGQALAKLLVVFMQMFMQAGPAAVKILNQLLPAIVDMASGLVPVVAGVTKLVALIVDWLAKNHLLIPALIALGAAIAVASGGLTLIIPAIALVVGGIVHLWQTSQKFRDIVTTAFSAVARVVLSVAEIWLSEWHGIVDVVLTSGHYILDAVYGVARGLDAVFHTHMADAVRSAQGSFDRFRAAVDNTFNAAHSRIEGWKRDLANMPKVVKLEGNIADLTAKLNSAKAQLRDPHLTATRRARVEASIAQLQAALAEAQRELAAINGTTAVTYVTTINNVAKSVPGGLAHGGITGAAGGGPRGRWTMVGEHGREIVELPPGTNVRSNPDTERMLSGATRVDVRLSIDAASFLHAGISPQQLEMLRYTVRTLGGGDVQRAFGG